MELTITAPRDSLPLRDRGTGSSYEIGRYGTGHIFHHNQHGDMNQHVLVYYHMHHIPQILTDFVLTAVGL